MLIKKKLSVIVVTTLAISLLLSLSGCSFIESKLNDIKGDLIGNGFNAEAYDNYGEQTMAFSGDKISLKGNRVSETTYTSDGVSTTHTLSSVVTVTIDGKELETCGDTVIFAEKGLEKDVSETNFASVNSTSSGALTENTLFAYNINKFKNMIGKNRAIVIKSQMGRPICIYSGDNVYYEVCENLPKTTKLMIDGKALYVHRANFQIVDKQLIG